MKTIDGKVVYEDPGTPEEILGKIIVNGECCSCEERIALAMALHAGIVPLIPDNYTTEEG